MSLVINGIEPQEISFNDIELTEIYCKGQIIWRKNDGFTWLKNLNDFAPSDRYITEVKVVKRDELKIVGPNKGYVGTIMKMQAIFAPRNCNWTANVSPIEWSCSNNAKIDKDGNILFLEKGIVKVSADFGVWSLSSDVLVEEREITHIQIQGKTTISHNEKSAEMQCIAYYSDNSSSTYHLIEWSCSDNASIDKNGILTITPANASIGDTIEVYVHILGNPLISSSHSISVIKPNYIVILEEGWKQNGSVYYSTGSTNRAKIIITGYSKFTIEASLVASGYIYNNFLIVGHLDSLKLNNYSDGKCVIKDNQSKTVTFENIDGGTHIIEIYRYIDSYYSNAKDNYGKFEILEGEK